MLCQNYGLSQSMSNGYFFRAVLAAALLAFGACGSKPSSRQATERPLAPETETTASAAPPVTPVSKAESTNTKAPAVEPPTVPKVETLPSVIRKTFPTAGSARLESSPFPHRVIQDRAEQVLGYEVYSDSAGVTARGYAGMVPVQVFLDAHGKPVRIYVLDNCETPAYLDLVYGAGLLDKLLAFDPARPDSIDAVTLATSSSRAIIAGVAGLAARVSAEIVAKGQGLR
jgi:uncharacterized protein with FMN-binding domain